MNPNLFTGKLYDGNAIGSTQRKLDSKFRQIVHDEIFKSDIEKYKESVSTKYHKPNEPLTLQRPIEKLYVSKSDRLVYVHSRKCSSARVLPPCCNDRPIGDRCRPESPSVQTARSTLRRGVVIARWICPCSQHWKPGRRIGGSRISGARRSHWVADSCMPNRAAVRLWKRRS